MQPTIDESYDPTSDRFYSCIVAANRMRAASEVYVKLTNTTIGIRFSLSRQLCRASPIIRSSWLVARNLPDWQMICVDPISQSSKPSQSTPVPEYAYLFSQSHSTHLVIDSETPLYYRCIKFTGDIAISLFI